MDLTKEQIYQNLLNFYKRGMDNIYLHQSADSIADSIFTNTLYSEYPGVDQLLEECSSAATFEGYTAFIKRIFEKLYIEFYFAGSISKSQCEHLVSRVINTADKISSHSIYTPSSHKEAKLMAISPGGIKIYEHFLTSPEHLNSALKLSIQVEKAVYSRAYCYVLQQYLCEPFFNEFRTEDQLGYHCELNYNVYRGNYVFYFLVVSSVLDTH